MIPARILPLARYRADRIDAARGVVTRAEAMSLIDEDQRRAVLTLAWSILREDRDLHQLPRPAPTEPAQVIPLADHQPRDPQRPQRPVPHITLAPFNPHDPKDAA